MDGPSMMTSALILPRLTIYAGGGGMSARDWPHLRGLELADPDFLATDPIEILLGADVHAVIIRDGIKRGRPCEPVGQNTALGWIISGAADAHIKSQYVHTHQCTIGDDLSMMVRRFWEQEELPVTAAPLTPEERECEDLFNRTHIRLPDGRYMVRLPVTGLLPDFSNSRQTAARVLAHVERRLERDSTTRTLYCDFMRQYEDLGHMSMAEAPTSRTSRRTCYLPHHDVLRAESSSTKLRVVFNGSSTIASGQSLNDYLYPGPNLLPSLADVLLRWRLHKYVLAADVEKMFRQIQVHPEDRDLQRILWRHDEADKIRDYQLNTVTYGLACAPFLAMRTLRQLADDEENHQPLGAAILRRDVYMDDILTGAANYQEAKEIQRQLSLLCSAGGFPLKKWSANNIYLLEYVPKEDRLQRDSLSWLLPESHSTLGLRWHPSRDHFSVVCRAVSDSTPTKRSVLSQAAQLFDPLGWLARMGEDPHPDHVASRTRVG
ncbi:PREDICTED: uncharacterized protein LOC108777070 [Cyphomyrmex costatus]|uniref:uncharacterized protein LOC108777070 n=1 Tax=Cyphomyrmex costatus TaxID=456900 RepID=UPI0008522D69|nr:PREDICTED: uncharacterized protein LOC108777070 [Cyphomyrmex costatus]